MPGGLCMHARRLGARTSVRVRKAVRVDRMPCVRLYASAGDRGTEKDRRGAVVST